MALKDLLGASIALISPAARVAGFPGLPELFVVIDTIIELIDTAKCNREALPVMREYMSEVKNTIKGHEHLISNKQTPALMNALNDWEKFLYQYTKPKMKKLLSILTADKTSRKIQDLFNNLEAALESANLHVNLDSNRILNQLQKKQNITDRKIDSILDNQASTSDKLDAILKLVVQNEFVTTACFHNGAPLAKERIDELKLNPEWIKPAPNAHAAENGLTKVIYCHGSEAAKIHIGVVGDNMEKYYVRAYISARLNSDLFANNYGILQEGNNYYMITEWPALGTLNAYLKKYKGEIGWKEKIRMAVRLARAVAFCHSKLILHHDICSHNAIVDKSRNVKLGNFHRSRGIKDVTTPVNGESESVRWLCPEKVKDGKISYSKEADVYSFGMLMWEITSHEVPFEGKSYEEVYQQQKESCVLPPIINGTPKAYEKVMRSCWDQNPKRRPPMEKVVKELEHLENTYENDTQSMYSESIASIATESQSNPDVTIQTAIKLHKQKNHEEAYAQFQILADGEKPDAQANFYVGLYLMDQKIQHEKNPDIGESYLEVASELGFTQAVQYRAQSKMAAATELRKKFLDAGQKDDAEAIKQRMKSECLPLFKQGAESGDLRCMKDLAHYGADLGDEDSYRLGMKMLKDRLAQPISERDKDIVNDYLKRLQQFGEKFNKN